MYQQRPNFRDLFDEAYKGDARTKARALSESLSRSGVPAGIGHPDYEYVEIGETEPGTVVVFFMDVRGFTKLAMALENQEVVRILQATLAASVACIAIYGGHVADFTGDGIMATFGGRYSTDAEDAFNAVCAAAMLMKGIRDVVADHLETQGLEPVRIGMGIEYGEVLWTRLGLPNASQVKPISGVSFLAGKLSTAAFTRSWECKIGQNLAAWLPDDYKVVAKRYEFQHNGTTYTHGLYVFDWEAFCAAYELSPSWIEHTAKSRVLPPPTWPTVGASVLRSSGPAVQRAGPRPLKDQPFFAF